MKKLTFGQVLEDSTARDEYYRAEDVEALVRLISRDRCPWCGHGGQITTPRGPCMSCGKPWDLKDWCEAIDGPLPVRRSGES